MPVSCSHKLPHHDEHYRHNRKDDQCRFSTFLPPCLHHRVQLVQFSRYSCETFSDLGCDLFVHALAPDRMEHDRLPSTRAPKLPPVIKERFSKRPSNWRQPNHACQDEHRQHYEEPGSFGHRVSSCSKNIAERNQCHSEAVGFTRLSETHQRSASATCGYSVATSESAIR